MADDNDELSIVDLWLTATLRARTQLIALLPDGANAINNTEAPPDPKTQYPFVVHQYQGGLDVRGAGPNIIMISGLWVVKAVNETRDYLSIAPAARQIHLALQAGAGVVADGFVFSCVREQPYRMAERSLDGHDFRHAGGIYRCLAQLP